MSLTQFSVSSLLLSSHSSTSRTRDSSSKKAIAFSAAAE